MPKHLSNPAPPPSPSALCPNSGTLSDAGGGAKPFSLDLFYAGSDKKDARPVGISAGVATLIKIYALVLAGKVLLNFIPNVPWEKQPMAAMSHVTDPYLHTFQKGFVNVCPLGI
ncbi:hypothetical protein RHMOL_Rhmol13G0064700 [Rhododendron molle]|uniref:Uncharacterized protein n=1 Tax=Rhododendron molle TaxID=49168 RepID=A0ACC0L574_RHOML|nr:hypothetical protein RHMOL_Rhmol13G0064700 [Rhododendron molle]